MDAGSIPAASTTFVSRGTRQDGIQENPGWEEGIKVSRPRGWFYARTRPSPNSRAAPSRCHAHRAACSTYSREGPRRNLWLVATSIQRTFSRLCKTAESEGYTDLAGLVVRVEARENVTLLVASLDNMVRSNEYVDREKDRDA